MNRFFKENRKMLAGFLIIAILFPAIILVKTPIGVIPSDTGELIVSYGGAILGGFLTLYGVWWTIETNKEKEREDRALQYRPMFQYDICQTEHKHQQNGEINFSFACEYFNNTDLKYLPYMIKLENIGRGEIEKIDFKICKKKLISASFGEFDKNKFLEMTSFLGNEYINFIPVNGTVYIQLGVPEIKKEYISEFRSSFWILLETTLDMNYKGLFSEKRYNQSLDFHLSITYDGVEYTCEFYNTSLDLKIVPGESADVLSGK